ncbi:MAG: hypothetical protein LBI84_07455 [Propionibacteriaceae bacterium]|nr:hypothetical protein [Propionibacteriaceae bacterium]
MGDSESIVELSVRRLSDEWELQMVADGLAAAGNGSSAWAALRDLRRALEPLGYRLCCNGARLDVYSSRMSMQMGSGRRAYVLTPGKQALSDDLVDIFVYAPSSTVGTIEQQDEAFRRWLDSLG